MLTNLPLKMMLMITYLSHWDWILYKSRKDLIKYINSDKIHAMCPSGAYEVELGSIYNGLTFWELDRKKLLDIKAILKLRSHIKNINGSFHCFTLKTGILFLKLSTSNPELGINLVLLEKRENLTNNFSSNWF